MARHFLNLSIWIMPQNSFRELVRRTKAAAIVAFQNVDVPFAMVVDALSVQRSASFTPVYQVSSCAAADPCSITCMHKCCACMRLAIQWCLRAAHLSCRRWMLCVQNRFQLSADCLMPFFMPAQVLMTLEEYDIEGNLQLPGTTTQALQGGLPEAAHTDLVITLHPTRYTGEPALAMPIAADQPETTGCCDRGALPCAECTTRFMSPDTIRYKTSALQGWWRQGAIDILDRFVRCRHRSPYGTAAHSIWGQRR